MHERHAMRILLAAALAIGLSGPGSGCASSRTLAEQGEDLRLAARVGRRLTADPDVERFAIDVDVIDGVVTLRGVVDDLDSAEEAALIAKRTEGVVRVVNKLEIAGDEPDEPFAGDLGIRAAVGTRLLADPEVRRVSIDVDVIDGVVYLSGVVDDREAKLAAERIAGRVAGVRRVENELQVRADDDEDPAREREVPE